MGSPTRGGPGQYNKSNLRHGSSSKRVRDFDDETYEVEQILNKKIYKGQNYYQLKWAGCEKPTWEPESSCHCDKLIKDYEKRIKVMSADENEDEWEVEKILDKRTLPNKRVEYLVKWKNWDGEDQWIDEEDCQCINLIAAYENPKLRKMWDFQGSNKKLWIEGEQIRKFFKSVLTKKAPKVNLLTFESDFPQSEQPLDLRSGLNIGPLSYKDHWYLVIILVDHICPGKQILVCDPLNTIQSATENRTHPVFKRLKRVYKGVPVAAVIMTPMDRSDLCGYYVLAALERALFVYSRKATSIAKKLYFDFSRPELLRMELRPETKGEFSVALPVSSVFLTGPRCEFCDDLFDNNDLVDQHIKKEHFQ